LAPETLAEALSEKLEVELVGRGEAGQRTADWLMRTLGVRLEHARYLSRNDLLALTCVQYEHVNLAPLWTLLEAALLSPYREEATMSARGLTLRYLDGRVEVQSPADWLRSHSGDANQRAHDLAGIIFELRQYAALLDAHHLPLVLPSAETSETSGGYLLETFATADAGYDAPSLYAHEAPGLGVVAVTLAQRGGGRARILAHGYPFHPQALGALVANVADRYGVAPDLHALGRILLDTEGQLGAPADSLH
jgi:hypothetical protein